ncbi:MAG: DUF6033 family protein [Lachnospiraceae bacterium]|nr:DUF6033 family protein [Lachnospiraceae bacterium]
MNINGIGNYASYNFFQVSQGDTAKAGQKDDDWSMKLAKRQEINEDPKTEKRAESDKKLKEQQEKLKTDKQAAAQKKLDDTYAKLSDRAKEYLNTLKERYGNMDIYVADDVDESDTQSIMSSGTKEYSAMMDSETLEKMAANEDVAANYEEMISSSISELDSLKDEFTEKGVNVGTVGVSINNDGEKSYYSIIDDSLSYYDKQLKEQEAKDAKKAEEAKAERKQAEKEEEAKKEKRAEELEEERKKDEAKREEFMKEQLGGKRTLVEAGTIDELKAKLQLQADKVETLKRSSVFVGLGIDASA